MTDREIHTQILDTRCRYNLACAGGVHDEAHPFAVRYRLHGEFNWTVATWRGATRPQAQRFARAVKARNA